MNQRVESIFKEHMDGDTSYQETSFLFPIRYKQSEVREVWRKGIKHGIFLGLLSSSLEGQRIELMSNTKDKRHKEFIEKFYKLAEEYECAVQHHPRHGMVIVDRKYNP